MKNNIALIDLDSTIADHDAQLEKDLKKMSSPEEIILLDKWREKKRAPSYMFQRMKVIRNNVEWWENLPVIEKGMELVEIMQSIGFRIVILTQGPRANSHAWQGKVNWVNKHLGEKIDITITRDKSMVYGKVLYDDYPPYVDSWLTNRPRGLAILNSYSYNQHYKNKNSILYENNKDEVVELLREQFKRNNKRK
jgi:5'-nucleotidase